jgi:peptidoglycan hydrolase-like protein with peptidoglycan-binding domain
LAAHHQQHRPSGVGEDRNESTTAANAAAVVQHRPSGVGEDRNWSGDRPHIRQLQERLRARGWSIAVTGWYDAAMVAVVRKFQGEKGLHVDGLTGRDTWRTAWESPIT